MSRMDEAYEAAKELQNKLREINPNMVFVISISEDTEEMSDDGASLYDSTLITNVVDESALADVFDIALELYMNRDDGRDWIGNGINLN